jgi:hypothetical protein
MVSKAFNFKTHRELVTMPREFFSSLLLNTLLCYQKCLCGNLFNTNKTHLKLPLRLALETHWLSLTCM